MKKSIVPILNYIDSIEFINCGGCGIVAYTVHKWLKLHGELDDHFNFIMLYRKNNGNDKIRYKENSTILANNGEASKLMVPTHIGLLNGPHFIDSTGLEEDYATDDDFHLINNPETLLGIINGNETLPWYNNWCNKFDRMKYVPMIAKHTGIDLSEIKIGLPF